MAIKSLDKVSSQAEASALPAREPLFVAQPPALENGQRKINVVLIANRGEIACRIISTCRKLNLTSVALYTEEDTASRHITDADHAICIGSVEREGKNPFLNVQLLVDTAVSAGVDAIHPGYGYLSENTDFADAVRKAGLIFLGPSSEAMSTLGDKRTSKEYLRQYGSDVPLIPGFAGSSQNIEDLETAAEEIGFPVMLKASAGGGGRGMRIIYERSKLKEQLQLAQSEAQNSFGSSDCILEKYIENGKHIEIQIVGDSHGNVVSLWERECSVQRRHQKVIEETPSPFLTPETRKKMSGAAIRIGELLGYESAGTVEFVVDARDSSFYFLEVNTRLQVEHPITEEVTGIDIVALQLYVAAGGSLKSLPILQKIPQSGHSIECRLCAEDPDREFMPEHGTIRLWKPSAYYQISRDVRFETAVQSGANVSIYFDSMIAKIVVWAPTRILAIEKITSVLADTVCAGVRTNQLFLQNCLLHSAFQDPNYDTSFIPKHLQNLLGYPNTKNIEQIEQILCLVPGVVLRDANLQSTQKTIRRPFNSVRKAFRSQPFDPVNVPTTVIQAVGHQHINTSVASVWSSPGAPNSSIYQVTLLPLSELEEVSEKESSPAQVVTAKYNIISNKLRARRTSGAPNYQVDLKECKFESSGLSKDWKCAFVDVTVNNSNITAYIATNSVVAGDAQLGISQVREPRSVLCHFPSLGTWIEYRCYDLLSFCESIRETVTAATASTQSAKAPMPCKVLKILKEDGEDVRAGENVMVIESMKMEMNISIGSEGKFHTSVRPGEAVSEGKVLCWVD